MSQRLPQEMRRFARVLMAGEEVHVLEKPDLKFLLIGEIALAAGGFVILFIIVSMFSDLPTYLKAALSLVFALAGCGVVHFAFATTTYLITDKRLLVVSDLGSEIKDSCELDEVTATRRLGFANQLVVERSSGNPIRMVALKNRDEIERVLIGE